MRLVLPLEQSSYICTYLYPWLHHLRDRAELVFVACADGQFSGHNAGHLRFLGVTPSRVVTCARRALVRTITDLLLPGETILLVQCRGHVYKGGPIPPSHRDCIIPVQNHGQDEEALVLHGVTEPKTPTAAFSSELYLLGDQLRAAFRRAHNPRGLPLVIVFDVTGYSLLLRGQAPPRTQSIVTRTLTLLASQGKIALMAKLYPELEGAPSLPVLPVLQPYVVFRPYPLPLLYQEASCVVTTRFTSAGVQCTRHPETPVVLVELVDAMRRNKVVWDLRHLPPGAVQRAKREHPDLCIGEREAHVWREDGSAAQFASAVAGALGALGALGAPGALGELGNGGSKVAARRAYADRVVLAEEGRKAVELSLGRILHPSPLPPPPSPPPPSSLSPLPPPPPPPPSP